MKTIAVAMQKGGCGKSTVSRHGAAILPNSALLDLDPQGTTLKWLEKRKAQGIETPTAIKVPLARLDDALAQVRAHGGVEYLVIDTPPEHDDQRAIRAAIRVADYVLLPAKPSPDDLEVLNDTLKLVRQAGKPHGFVLTMTRPTKGLLEAQELLTRVASQSSGELCPFTMGNRVAYTDSVFSAQAVTEYEPHGAAAEETTAIWNWAVERLDRAAAMKKEQA